MKALDYVLDNSFYGMNVKCEILKRRVNKMFPQTQVENILKEVKKHIDCYSGFKFDNGKIKFTVYHETSFSHYKPETITFSFSEIMSCYKVPHVQFLELWKSKGGTAFNLTI